MAILATASLHCRSGHTLPQNTLHLSMSQCRAGKTQWLHDYLGNNLPVLRQWAKKAVADLAESKPDSTPSLAGPMSHNCMAPRCASSNFVVSNGAYSSLVIQISVTTPSKFHQPPYRPRRDASLFVHTFQLRAERESYSTLPSKDTCAMWHS